MMALTASLAPLENLLALRIGNAFRMLKGIYGNEQSRSQILYIIAHRLRLQKDRVVVDWPGYSQAPERVRAEQRVPVTLAEQLQRKLNVNMSPTPLVRNAAT
jgi:cholesterol oxidase